MFLWARAEGRVGFVSLGLVFLERGVISMFNATTVPGSCAKLLVAMHQ